MFNSKRNDGEKKKGGEPEGRINLLLGKNGGGGRDGLLFFSSASKERGKKKGGKGKKKELRVLVPSPTYHLMRMKEGRDIGKEGGGEGANEIELCSLIRRMEKGEKGK